MKRSAYIVIVVLLSYSALLALFSLDSLPEKIFHGNFWPYLADKPISEDGFYLLTVANNISKGEGITYNFHTPTTGIQPLSAFIYSGIALINSFSGGDKFSFLRIIIFFDAILLILFAYLIYILLTKVSSNENKNLLLLLSFLLTALNFEVFILFTNGMETGINLIFITLLLIASLRFINSMGVKNLLLLAVTAGFTIMARIDSVTIVVAVLIYSFFSVKVKITDLLLCLIVIALIISPWFIYTYSLTGSLFPSSMQSQVSTVNFSDVYIRLTSMLKAILQHITFFIYTGNKDAVLYLYGFAVLFLLVKTELKHRALSQLLKRNKLLVYLGSALIFQVLTYVMFSFAHYFYFRYTAPFIILFDIIAVTLLIKTLKLSSITINRFVLSSLILVFFINAYFYFHSGKLGVHQSLRAGFINHYFNCDIKVGCFQSGVAGYFNGNVYNLDGKVDYNAYLSLSKGEILKYIDQKNIDVLIEWKEGLKFVENNERWKEFKYQIPDSKTLCLTRL